MPGLRGGFNVKWLDFIVVVENKTLRAPTCSKSAGVVRKTVKKGGKSYMQEGSCVNKMLSLTNISIKESKLMKLCIFLKQSNNSYL